jgi:hypothetical protein
MRCGWLGPLSLSCLVMLFSYRSIEAQKTGDQNLPSAQVPAWKLTLAQRFSRRFDPQAMAERREAELAERRAAERWFPGPQGVFAMPEADGKSKRFSEGVNGNRTPELFLPSELFGILLFNAFPPAGVDRAETWGPIERRAAALGFGSDLSTRLTKVTAALREWQLDLASKPRSLAYDPDAPEDVFNSEALTRCRLAAEALAAAKAEFGEEAFLRLLYLAVAPDHSVTYSIRSLEEHSRRLRFMEGGCR